MATPAEAGAWPTLRQLRQAILELLYPTRCVGCRRAAEIWCGDCQARLAPVSTPVCLACRRELRRRNRNHACPDSAARAWATARYRPPLDRALTHLKYHPDARLVGSLATRLEQTYLHAGEAASCVAAVPLGRKRLKQRGYNQAELLGRALAESLRLPFHPSAASRIRETESQVGLDPKARWANVDRAFQADPSIVRGHIVLLVDDVHTTGATLASCAAALTQAGAAGVVGLTVARA